MTWWHEKWKRTHFFAYGCKMICGILSVTIEHAPNIYLKYKLIINNIDTTIKFISYHPMIWTRKCLCIWNFGSVQSMFMAKIHSLLHDKSWNIYKKHFAVCPKTLCGNKRVGCRFNVTSRFREQEFIPFTYGYPDLKPTEKLCLILKTKCKKLAFYIQQIQHVPYKKTNNCWFNHRFCLNNLVDDFWFHFHFN